MQALAVLWVESVIQHFSPPSVFCPSSQYFVHSSGTVAMHKCWMSELFVPMQVWMIEWRVQEYKQAPLRAYRHTASSKIPTLSNKLRQLRVWLEHKRSLQKLFFRVKRNFIDYSWKCYNQEQSMTRYKQDNSLATQHCGSDASPFVQDHRLLNFSLYMIQLKT